MSTVVARTIQTPDKSPVAFPYGILIGTGSGTASLVNNIGVAGQMGFGVSPAPVLPSGMVALYGTNDPAAPTYGNYQYSDGSVMAYRPSFWYKYGTGSNGLAINVPDIKPLSYFADVATAAASGYALNRSAYNGGRITQGAFVDKYMCSNNNGIASSIKNGIILSSAQRGSLSTATFASLNGAPANTFAGSIAAAKTRGAKFFPLSRFLGADLALLANAHSIASINTTYCAWWVVSGVSAPRGNNNNALGDVNDAMIAYVYDGTYMGCGKTGSANFFSKTTHNGQESGICDINGPLWHLQPIGLTSDGTNFYLLNTSVDVSTITGGNTLATDAWGATGLAAMYTNIGATYQSLTASNSNKTFGSAAQVLSEATSGTAWAMTGSGIPLAGGVGGSNQFGNDYMYDARPNEMCPIAFGYWSNSGLAGPWAVTLNNSRGTSFDSCGFRSAIYSDA